MKKTEAYCVNRCFEPSDPFDFLMDRHYLLYALQGLLRVETNRQLWTLPPARAALIRAGSQMRVTILSRIESASVLFAADFIESPEQGVSVFDMSRLAIELVRECRRWTSDSQPLGDYAKCMFGTLGMVTCRLALAPTPCVLPVASSPELQKAIRLTESRSNTSPSFGKIAHDSGQSPRALARRFKEELGMTWSEMLRRIRIIRAVETLAQSRASVTEIAQSVGYSSLSGFNAAFKDLMQKTPTQYRASFHK